MWQISWAITYSRFSGPSPVAAGLTEMYEAPGQNRALPQQATPECWRSPGKVSVLPGHRNAVPSGRTRPAASTAASASAHSDDTGGGATSLEDGVSDGAAATGGVGGAPNRAGTATGGRGTSDAAVVAVGAACAGAAGASIASAAPSTGAAA